VGGTPNSELLIAIPGGFQAAYAVQTVCEIFNNAAGAAGQVEVAANGSTIIVFNSTSASPGNWTPGTVSVSGILTIPVT
jgi:hypothetical protein